MTNLKKTLAVVLAFAMMLSMGSAFAYSDVEAGTTVSEAVGILSNLEILTGFEDGTFRPDETVTRAQMAAIICRMLGYEDQAQSSMGSTVFADVAADHWASGYVNVAQAQGIINGYGDGNFGPEDKVTYEQAIKMIVASLGYDLAAARKGGYPTGYLAIASAEGITKKANGKVGDAAARSTIAVLVYNALEVQLMDQDSWSSDGDDRYSQTDETVLSKYLGVTKYEGVVANTPVTGVAAEGSYDATATPKFSLKDSFYWDYEDDKLVKVTHNPGAVVCDKVDVNAFLGKSVIAYIGEDDLTGKDTVFAIAESETKNDSFKISATQLVEKGEKYWDVADTVGYKKVGSSKIVDLTLADDATVYVNYVVDSNIDTTAEIVDKTRNGGTVEFISNDADSDYEVVVITAYKDEAVIESVEEVDGLYKFTTYNNAKLSRIDAEDEDTIAIVYKDGDAATVADLAANDTVSYVEVAKGFTVYFASSATVTGAVDSYDTENGVITIAGEDYEVSVASGITDVTKLSGEEGTFFLNVDGQIAHNETVASVAGNYALVLASYSAASGVDSGEYLQVVLTDGTLVEYQIGTNAKVYDAEGEVKNADVKAFFDAMLKGKKSGSDAKFATVEDVTANADLMVKLTVANDKITKVRLLEGKSDSVAGTAEFDAEAMSVGKLDIAEDTVIFSVKETTGVIEAEDIVIGTAADFFVDGEEIGGALVAYDEDDGIYAAAVGFGLEKAIDPTSDLFIVTGIKTKTIDDNDAYVVTGIQAGEEIQVTLYDEDQELVAPKKGNIILLAEANAEGYVSEIEVLFDGSKRIASVNASKDDEIYSGYGKVVKSSRNKFAINAAIVNDADASDVMAAADEEISYRAAATYTLLDYTESNTPDVSIESGSEWLFDVTEYESYAFVRYVDGRMAEVVVFRKAEVPQA